MTKERRKAPAGAEAEGCTRNGTRLAPFKVWAMIGAGFSPWRPGYALTAQNGWMDADLRSIVATLADLSDVELRALINVVKGAPSFAPRLLGWIEHACDWERNRRRGVEFPLQPLGAAIPPGERAVSLDAATVIRRTFARDSRAVFALLDALVGLLADGEQKH